MMMIIIVLIIIILNNNVKLYDTEIVSSNTRDMFGRDMSHVTINVRIINYKRINNKPNNNQLNDDIYTRFAVWRRHTNMLMTRTVVCGTCCGQSYG